MLERGQAGIQWTPIMTLLAGIAALLALAAPARAQADLEDYHSLCLPTGPPPAGGYDPYIGAVRERGTVVLGGVPGYEWHRGCGPTAAGMIVGYWDIHGFDALIPGSALGQSQAVDDAIATDAHYEDYSLPLDSHTTGYLDDASTLGGAHDSNCIADFMKTSWCARRNYWGWSRFSDMDDSFRNYVTWVNTNYLAAYECVSWNEMWEQFCWKKYVTEINANRPMVFLVDSSGNGQRDHYITAIGYRDVNGYPEYACFDTWAPAGSLRWARFWGVAPGQSWGIGGVTYVRLSGDILPDCNSNGIDDADDIAGGFSEDCNSNGVPDECDLLPNPPLLKQLPAEDAVLAMDFSDAGYPQFSTKQWDDITLADDQLLGTGQAFFYPETWGGYGSIDFLVELADAPGGAEAGANVLLTTIGSGAAGLIYWDFGGEVLPSGTYWLSVQASGGFINYGMVNWYRANEWHPNGSEHYYHNPGGGHGHGTDPAPGSTWHNTPADLAFILNTVLDPDCNTNGILDECDIAAGTSLDDNGNGIPDECETPAVCSGDCNCDGAIDWRDIDYFVAAMNDNIAAWEAMFSPSTPSCPFGNNDVNSDGTVNWRDIDPLVAVMNTTCP
ncbi:MAG: hypothetical protein KAY37_03300 [Phycisphaerae bacterium]|nr:hypothetical protein [Phycisphaerae bacterium]